MMLVSPRGRLGQQEKHCKLQTATPCVPQARGSSGNLVTAPSVTASGGDSRSLPRSPGALSTRQSVLSHRRRGGSAWELPLSQPCLAVSQLWEAPRCFGWDGICSWTSEVLKAGKQVSLEMGCHGKKKAGANSRTSAFTFSKY